MKLFHFVLLCSFIILMMIVGCQTQPAVVYSPAVQPVVQQPYQIYDNGSGGQVVYYNDPYSHASYYLEYALFMSMWNSPNRYYSINHYYVSNRSYVNSYQGRYRSTYTHSYRPSSPSSSGSYRPNSPSSGSRPSSPSGSSYRPSSPSSSSYRPSSPSQSRSSYSPRSSSPGGRRH